MNCPECSAPMVLLVVLNPGVVLKCKKCGYVEEEGPS